MRILLVTSFPVPGEYDGTAMLPIKILRALKTRGVDVVLAHLKARPPWGRAVREDFEGTPSFTFHPREWVGGLVGSSREFPFDLVHAQHHGGANRALFACRRYGWPMVYEIHSLLGGEYERDRLGRGLGFQINVRLERSVCRHAAAVIVLGEQVRRVMVEEKGRSRRPGDDHLPRDRPRRICPARACGDHPRDRPDHQVVMYVGSIVHPNQGVPLLVESLPGSSRRCPTPGASWSADRPRRASSIARSWASSATGSSSSPGRPPSRWSP